MIQPVSMNNVSAPVYLPSLTASRPRGGMRSISELVDCLIRYYDAKAQILDQRSSPANKMATPTNRLTQTAPKATLASVLATSPENQATFDWYDSSAK